MTVVSPFRPFPPESGAHHKLGVFDWVDAIRMLRASVLRSCRCETTVITDVDTDLPLPSHQFETHERRLMLWILEVSRCYLESPAFDDDTVMISPDMLVFQNLRPYFTADLGLMVRSLPKFIARDKRLMNGVQFWRLASRDRLVAFYRRVEAVAKTLPHNCIRWGADTEAIAQLVRPFQATGIVDRDGLSVAMLPAETLMRELNANDLARLARRQRLQKYPQPIVHLKYRKKHRMRAFFDATRKGAA